MNILKLKRLGMVGAAHIITPLLVIVGAGIIGTYMLVATHADSTDVTCSYNSHTYSGHKEYNCKFSLPTPVISSNKEVGTFHTTATNWVLCQQESTVKYTRKAGVYNYWWAYSVSDQGPKGWVNATYATTGANDGKFANVPLCSTTSGLQSAVETLPTLSSGTAVAKRTVACSTKESVIASSGTYLGVHYNRLVKVTETITVSGGTTKAETAAVEVGTGYTSTDGISGDGTSIAAEPGIKLITTPAGETTYTWSHDFHFDNGYGLIYAGGSYNGRTGSTAGCSGTEQLAV